MTTEQTWTKEQHEIARGELAAGLSLSVVGQRMMLAKIERLTADLDRAKTDVREIGASLRRIRSKRDAALDFVARVRAIIEAHFADEHAEGHPGAEWVLEQAREAMASSGGENKVEYAPEDERTTAERWAKMRRAAGKYRRTWEHMTDSERAADVAEMLPLVREARAEIERAGRSEAACVREALNQVGALRAEIDRLRAEHASRPAPLTDEIDEEELWTDYRTECPGLGSAHRLAFLAGVDAGRRTRPASAAQDDGAAIADAAERLLESLGEYVRQSMHANREWADGIRAIEAALLARKKRERARPAPLTDRTLATLIRATAAWWAKRQTFIAKGEDDQLDVDTIAMCADALASRGYLRRVEWTPTGEALLLLKQVDGDIPADVRPALTAPEADAWALRTIPAPHAYYYRRAIGAALLASNRGEIPAEVRAAKDVQPAMSREIGDPAYDDIRAERERQSAKGRTAELDDERTPAQWRDCLGSVLRRHDHGRDRWVKVGSVAVAAIQSIDRLSRGDIPADVRPSIQRPVDSCLAEQQTVPESRKENRLDEPTLVAAERDLVVAAIPPCGGLTYDGQRAIAAVARQVAQEKALRKPAAYMAPEQESAAMADWHARQLADRIAAGERATVPVGYAARRAAGEGGHGMAERWRPTPGARVVTVGVGALGRVTGIARIMTPTGTIHRPYTVRHDDGTQRSYDADELAPAPEAAK